MKTSFARLPRSATAVALVLSAALAACGDGDGDGDHPAPELDAAEIAAIEALADQAILAGIPAVSVVIQAGAQTVRIARGVEDRTTGAPVTADHRFRVGSVAKSMLASITLQLVGEGKLRLGDTVESQLPGMVAGNSQATIEQVLRLESGIFDHAEDPRYLAPYLEGDLEHVYSPQQLLALSNDHPPVFAPGERFMYSNTNYVIIGLIIEKLTGLSLAEAVAQRITTPLGMTATTLPLVSAMPVPYAHGYLMGGGEPVDVTAVSASSTFGHGNAVSTGADLNRFFAALVAGKVVDPARLPAMFAPDPAIESNYGIGVWTWADWPCGAWVGHEGSTAGYFTFSYSRRDGRRQVTVLASSITPEDRVGDQAAQQAWKNLISGSACQ